MKLNELKIGQCARITSVGGEGALRQHFLDMGVIPGAEVTLVKLAPMGDPMELQIHGYELTLRVADAGEITIDPIDERTRKHERPDRIYKSDHPGLGETGKYHACLLYTSDAADDQSSVDLGGRRIIKKKFFQAEDGIRDYYASRGLGDVYKRQI